jgi:pyrroline-5-carboxylate reductase
MTAHTKIVFIGGGNMAAALIEGLLRGATAAADLHVVEVNEQARHRWHERGLSTSESCCDTLSTASLWVLAVKPQQLKDVVMQAKPYLVKQTLVLSIAAGVSLQTLCYWLGSPTTPWPQVIRAMPNTPALVDKGITGLVASTGVTAAHRELVQAVLSAVSELVWVQNDDQIDAITALSGSGPAYVFRFLEALVAGGQALGLTHEQAKRLALATLAGATQLAAQSPDSLATLRERVTSKGGTTEAALTEMQKGAVFETVVNAMRAAYERAGELSVSLNDEQSRAQS